MNMSFREAILDALVDDGESIKQISEYLQYLGVQHSREAVVEMVSTMLDEKLIRISYPEDRTVKDFQIASSEEKLDFWFELTDQGHAEWDKIE